LTKIVIGKELSKDKDERCTNWHQPLSKKKIQYAAADGNIKFWLTILVWAPLEIYHMMREAAYPRPFGIESSGNNPKTRVLLDSFHAVKRVTDLIPMHHPHKWVFATTLRDMVFIRDEDDWNAADAAYKHHLGKSVEEVFAESPDKVLKSVRRQIPDPKTLIDNLLSILAEFSKVEYQDEDGFPVLNEQMKKEIKKLTEHAEKGCLSDPPGIPLYYKCSKTTKV
jgi:hypothetical protein